MANDELVRPEQRLLQALEKARNSFSAVAAKRVTAERLIKVALGAATRNPMLLQCTTQSIVRAVMQGAELGFEPGSALQLAHLVPRKNNKMNPPIWEAQLIIDYRGYVDLAYRSGIVSFLTAEVVYQDDLFEFELGLDPKLKHIPNGDDIDPSKIIYAYMVVGMKDGSKSFKVLNRKQLDRIRQRADGSSSAYSPWNTDTAAMYMKTAIRNRTKLIPKSIEMAKAERLDDAIDTGDMSLLEFDIPEALELPGPSEPTKGVNGVKDKAKAKGAIIDENAFGAPIPLTLELGMPENERLDFVIWCESNNLEPENVQAQAKAAGV